MRFTGLLIGAILLAGGAVAHDHGAKAADPDKAAVKAAVFDYFEGQGEASLERLERAFHPDASMFGVLPNDDGEQALRVWPNMSDVVKNWAANDNPPGERDGEILSMDIVDGRIAVVQFRSTDRFYDSLTLVKIDGEWKIAAKVFVLQ